MIYQLLLLNGIELFVIKQCAKENTHTDEDRDLRFSIAKLIGETSVTVWNTTLPCGSTDSSLDLTISEIIFEMNKEKLQYISKIVSKYLSVSRPIERRKVNTYFMIHF